jgi:hypothetical protein
MKDSNDDLNKKLNEWVESQGYPLEIEVANEFQQHGFNVIVSDWYKDYESQTLREVDVSATTFSDMNKPKTLQISWEMSCKTSRDKPWISFISENQLKQELAFNTMCSPSLSKMLFEEWKKDKPVNPLIDHPLLNPQRVCHSITQAFTTSVDIPFQAVMSAVKACVHMVTRTEVLTYSNKRGKGTIWYVAFPVVVIDGKLFECFIDRNGRSHLSEVQRVVLPWPKIEPINSWPRVHIITRPELQEFTRQAAEATAILMATLV